MRDKNSDTQTVEGFGDEWSRFDQAALDNEERRQIFDGYFALFPWHSVNSSSIGYDVGCGSGRWAAVMAPQVGRLHCVDPSVALEVARKNLAGLTNCEFHSASVGALPFDESSMDFGYSLGVLHHVPDPQGAFDACVRILKPGAPFLVYVYYALDNRPGWFRALWKLSDVFRSGISRLPHTARYFVSQAIATLVYYPLARMAGLLERLGTNVSYFPLSAYRNRSFYVMRTDALDRFGTRLEHRFTRAQVRTMMERSGLEHIVFSEKEPFWCALGYRRQSEASDDD